MACSVCGETGHKAPSCKYNEPPVLHFVVQSERLCSEEIDTGVPEMWQIGDRVKERPLCSLCSTEYLVRFGRMFTW